MSSSYTSLFFHIVWTTKGRVPFFSKRGKGRLFGYLRDMIENKRKVELLAIGGMTDHVHVLVRTSSLESIAGFVRYIKSTSSGFINREIGDEHRFEWQSGYGAFTVSASLVKKIRRYILDQEKHHKDFDFEEELEFFLDS